MRDKLTKRLEVLKEELTKGDEVLAKKQQEIANLQITMARIQGAIQVLTEELKEEPHQEI